MANSAHSTVVSGSRNLFGDVGILMMNLLRGDDKRNMNPFKKLPVELVRYILEMSSGDSVTVKAVCDYPHATKDNGNDVYICVPISVPRNFKVSCVSVHVESKDQGWSSQPDEYGKRNSFTWGEIMFNSLPEAVKMQHPGLCDRRWEVYRNLHGGTVYEEQTKLLTADDETGRDLFQSFSNIYMQRYGEYGTEEGNGGEWSNVEMLLVLRSCNRGWRNRVRKGRLSITYKYDGKET